MIDWSPPSFWCALGGCLVVALMGGCAGTCERQIKIEEDLHDPDPARRVTAVAAVQETRDAAAVPLLIELLADRDPAVRLAAYSALRELTGRETGYRPWISEEARRDAVLEWRAWWATRGTSP